MSVSPTCIEMTEEARTERFRIELTLSGLEVRLLNEVYGRWDCWQSPPSSDTPWISDWEKGCWVDICFWELGGLHLGDFLSGLQQMLSLGNHVGYCTESQVSLATPELSLHSPWETLGFKILERVTSLGFNGPGFILHSPKCGFTSGKLYNFLGWFPNL